MNSWIHRHVFSFLFPLCKTVHFDQFWPNSGFDSKIGILRFFFRRPSLQTVDSILKSFVACGRAKDWNMFSYCRNYWSHLLSSVLMLLCTHQEYVQAWQDASGTMAGEKFHAWYAVPEGGEAEAVQLPRFLNLPLEVGVAQWLKTKEAWDCKVASLAMEGKVLAPKAKTLHAACLN